LEGLTPSGLLIVLLSGLSVAGTLFMVSAGLTLAFGAMRIINMAHGSFYMFGAYLGGVVLLGETPGADMTRLVAAILVVPLAVGALGLLVEVGVMRRIYAKEHLTQLLATYALFLVFADVGLLIWGPQMRSVFPPDLLRGQIDIAGASFPGYSVFVSSVAAVVGIGLWVLLTRTKLGWQIQAMVEDPELVAASGVNVRLVTSAIFMLATSLAALAGLVVSPRVSVGPGLDGSILVYAFVVTVIGGLGSVSGAAVGALILGLFEAFSILVIPQWSSVGIYLMMIVVLLIRPSGLFGRQDR
jgi:branched-chain amino acid transport system permease protein